MSGEQPTNVNTTTHFRIHDERRWRRQFPHHPRLVWTRWTICDRPWPELECRTVRETNVVTCPICMVMKDLWLEGKRKPLTLRRARLLRRSINVSNA